jgi:hypothetical protein
MKAAALLTTSLALLLLLGSCGWQAQKGQDGACLNGGSACAAADAPPGMRGVLRGYRMATSRWIAKDNKESGVPDIGIKAGWEPITTRR